MKLKSCILRVKFETNLSNLFIQSTLNDIDLRNTIHPKKEWIENEINTNFDVLKPYYQTFQSNNKFTPNLSCLDLIFNCGVGSIKYF